MKGEKTLTDILPRTIQRVKMVQIRERAEELARPAHLVPNHKPALPRALHRELLDHGPVPFLDVPHHLLVDLERVLGGFLEEHGVRDRADVSCAMRVRSLVKRNIV